MVIVVFIFGLSLIQWIPNTLLRVSLSKGKMKKKLGTDFPKVPQHSDSIHKLWSKRLAFVIVFFIQDIYS